MAESDVVFSSKLKYDGIFSFKDLYKFCYDWLSQEPGLTVVEGKYAEKVKGTIKDIDVETRMALCLKLFNSMSLIIDNNKRIISIM